MFEHHLFDDRQAKTRTWHRPRRGRTEESLEHQLTLVRNPYFKVWSKDAQPQGYPDIITERYDLTGEAEVTQVENGQADWIGYSVPSDRLNEIGSKYPNQVHLSQLTANWYLPMNVNLPPFNNLKARQAVNFAVDRNAALRLFGGTNLGTPSCTILPPGFPGHVDYCPYTKNPGTKWSAPDVASSRSAVWLPARRPRSCSRSPRSAVASSRSAR